MSIQVISDKWPTARKEHRCALCFRRIQIGEKYHRQWNIWDDEPYTWIGCRHCEAMSHLCDMWANTLGDGVSEDDFIDYEPNTIAEARWLIGWRRKWTRRDGSLYPVPSREALS